MISTTVFRSSDNLRHPAASTFKTQRLLWKASPARRASASGSELSRTTAKEVWRDSPLHGTKGGLRHPHPVLVVLSGLFAGLTLGYMSLDETQLQVLSLQGTPKQKEYADRIMPIRKDGHLLLTTLLIANMITNETLPIIADPLLGGGVQAVIVSIVLVVIFAELIPQSVCSRYGLAIGAKLAPLTASSSLFCGPSPTPFRESAQSPWTSLWYRLQTIRAEGARQHARCCCRTR